jgi:hypothetical protein
MTTTFIAGCQVYECEVTKFKSVLRPLLKMLGNSRVTGNYGKHLRKPNLDLGRFFLPQLRVEIDRLCLILNMWRLLR